MSASVWWQARCRYEIAWTDDLLDTLIDTAPAEASLVVGGLRDGVSFCFAVRACDHRAATEQAIVLAAQMIRAALAETGHDGETPLTTIESLTAYDEQIWS